MSRFKTALNGGGYPDSATGTANSGVDVDIIPILKAHEVANGTINAEDPFELKVFSIVVDADTWIQINNFTEKPIFSAFPYADDTIVVKSLMFKNDVGYSIVYSF